jgi:hypothetical protein
MLVTSSGQTPDVIATDPGTDVDLLGITLLLFVGPRYYQELFRVRQRSLSQCIRQSGQATFVLHVMKKLR